MGSVRSYIVKPKNTLSQIIPCVKTNYILEKSVRNKILFIANNNLERYNRSRRTDTMIMDRIALIISIIGALNWGSIGLFKFDIVAWLCGGQTALVSRIIYTVVALAGIWCVSLLFRTRERFESIDE